MIYKTFPALSQVASPPTNLMVTQVSPTTLVISWTPPTPLGDTTGYRIYYSGGSNGSVDISGGSTDNHTVTGLQNGAIYQISIVGTSEHFFSDHVDYPSNITLRKFLASKSSAHYPLYTLHSGSSRHANHKHQLCSSHHHLPLMD